MSLTVASARGSVRRFIQDGQSPDATPVAYNLVRLEDLTDEIPIVATPTQRVFMIRFEGVNLGVTTVFAVPGTLRAYVDGSSVPTAPTVDVDANGNFTLPVAPVNGLLVSYGWQLLADGDVDSYVDSARAWMAYTDLPSVPDGLTPPLVKYAAAQALQGMARKLSQPDSRGGEASEALSDLTKSYLAQAKDLMAEAEADRQSFWEGADQHAQPAASVGSLNIPPWQPLR